MGNSEYTTRKTNIKIKNNKLLKSTNGKLSIKSIKFIVKKVNNDKK